MIKLEDIQAQQMLTGIVPEQIVRIIAADMAGEAACTVCFRDAHGKLSERMLFRDDEAKLAYASEGRPWAFDADAAQFKLAAEAYRIHLAHLFDPMMAVHASDVEPLPHQITAVYDAMLPRQPLRFVLADDPGAGKTNWADSGKQLAIKTLRTRAVSAAESVATQ